MQKIKYLFLILSFIISTNISANKDKVTKPKTDCAAKNDAKENKEVKEILKHFSIVIQNFCKIIMDPNNPINVTEAIAAMLAQMIKIASTMKRSISMEPITQEEIIQLINSMDTESKAKLIQMCHDLSFIK